MAPVNVESAQTGLPVNAVNTNRAPINAESAQTGLPVNAVSTNRDPC